MNCKPFSLLKIRANARFWRVAALLFIFSKPLSAQVFEIKTDAKEIALGSTFEVIFSLKNAEGERFKAPAFNDFKITSGPSQTRGMSIVNGRASSQQTWSYELQPKKAGTFTLGAASIVVNGKTLTTQPLTLKVVPARAKPNVNVPPDAKDDLFVVGELSSADAYSGQQVTWRLQLYTQVSVEGADIIELPDFQGFYAKEKRRFDTRTTYQMLRGKRYAVRTLHEEALFPQSNGEMTIGAARVRAGIEQPGAFGAFLGPRPVILQTQPVLLRVKTLPAPVPGNFSGGAGQYEWSVQVDKDSLTTDDAFTLTIAVRGNGDSKRFAAPKLTLPAGLEAFEPKIKEEEEYENGEEVVHSKVLEYVILPKEPGRYTLSPTLVFFDPDSNRYRTLQADSLPEIRVAKGKNYGIEQTIPDTLNPALPTISPKKDLLEYISEWFRSPVLWGLLAFPLFAFGIFLLLKKQKNISTAPVKAPARRPKADSARAARERFARAARLSQGGDPRAFYDALFKALQGYLAERLLLTPAQMSQENVRKLLAERNISPSTIQNLLAVWQTCEQALFAAQMQATQMENARLMAESVVQDLEKNLR